MEERRLGIEKDLECPVCLSVFKNGRYLSCLHTFCEGCIEGLSNGGLKVVCPECRQVTSLDQEMRASGLKPNIVANRLAETLESSSCSSASKTLGPDSDGDTDVCKKHPPNVLKYYCKRCQALICSECSMEQHREHACDVCLARTIDRKNGDTSAMHDLLQSSEDTLRQHLEVMRELDQRYLQDTEILAAAALCKLKLDESFALLVSRKEEAVGDVARLKTDLSRQVTRREDINQLGRDLLENGDADEISAVLPQWSDALRDMETFNSTDIHSRLGNDAAIADSAGILLNDLGKLQTFVKKFHPRDGSSTSTAGEMTASGSSVAERTQHVAAGKITTNVTSCTESLSISSLADEGTNLERSEFQSEIPHGTVEETANKVATLPRPALIGATGTETVASQSASSPPQPAAKDITSTKQRPRGRPPPPPPPPPRLLRLFRKKERPVPFCGKS